MGKWDGKTKTLEKYPADELVARHPKRETFLAEIPADERISPSALAERYLTLRHELDAVEAIEKDINLRIAVVADLFQAAAEASNTASVKLTSGAAVRVQHEPHAYYAARWCVSCQTEVGVFCRCGHGTKAHVDGECRGADGEPCAGYVAGAERVAFSGSHPFTAAEHECPAVEIGQVKEAEIVTGKEAFRRHCLDLQLHEDMTLLWASMNAMMKAALEEGEPTPPGVKAFDRAKLVPQRLDLHPKPAHLTKAAQPAGPVTPADGLAEL